MAVGSLGELVIELGVVGDTKKLEQARQKLLETAKEADNYAKAIRKAISDEIEIEKNHRRTGKGKGRRNPQNS